MRVLLLGLGVIMLTACAGASGSSGPTETPAASAGTTPNALSLVNCPPSGQGASGGDLTGLGASIGAFEGAHQPRDRQHDAEFGQVWQGSTNYHLNEFAPRCTQAGYIGSVTHYLGSPITAEQAKAAIPRDLGPSDSKQADDKVSGSCELVFYHSDTLATIAGLDDPAGNFVVELTSSTANGGGYAASDVESLLYDSDTSGGC